MPSDLPRSRSRKVNAYVAASLRHQRLHARLQRKLDALKPLTGDVAQLAMGVRFRRAKLTGGQLAEAERLLRQHAAAQDDPDARLCVAAGRRNGGAVNTGGA